MSDQLHAKLTAIVGELIAESGQMKTYDDAIEFLVTELWFCLLNLSGELTHS
jgi:hypothetical protein